MFKRLRRNRKSFAIRACLSEFSLKKSDFIMPFFVHDGPSVQEIENLPSNQIHSLDTLLKAARVAYDEGIACFLLFPVIQNDNKDDVGSFAVSDSNILFVAVEMLKEALPDAAIFVDVALDPYTSHGHDGVLSEKNYVDNDKTVEKLIELSLKLAAAGCDYIAPSDMMDGRVKMLRQALDQHGYTDVGIMSYSAKFASSLYGPFREVVGSSLKFGDKKSYQLSYSNSKEAIYESLIDVEEGADLLLVKPATLYMDIISEISKKTYRPVGAYHVSGEYAMACALAEKGLLDLEQYLLEVFTSLKRSGAQFIITYGYHVIKKYLK